MYISLTYDELSSLCKYSGDLSCYICYMTYIECFFPEGPSYLVVQRESGCFYLLRVLNVAAVSEDNSRGAGSSNLGTRSKLNRGAVRKHRLSSPDLGAVDNSKGASLLTRVLDVAAVSEDNSGGTGGSNLGTSSEMNRGAVRKHRLSSTDLGAVDDSECAPPSSLLHELTVVKNNASGSIQEDFSSTGRELNQLTVGGDGA